MDFFTRAIEFAIIEDVPAQVVGPRVMRPGARDWPDFGMLREHSDFISAPGNEQACGGGIWSL